MKSVLAFAGSNSKHSINKAFVGYVSNQLHNATVSLIDLNDYPLPLFSVDLEKAAGAPDNAKAFRKLLDEHDAYIISLAEHNMGYTAAFKNLLDWVSRIEPKIWGNKPMCLLSTSPGRRGATNVLDTALRFFPFMGADIKTHFSLPSYNDNFDVEKGVTDKALSLSLESTIATFESSLR